MRVRFHAPLDHPLRGVEMVLETVPRVGEEVAGFRVTHVSWEVLDDLSGLAFAYLVLG